MLSLECSLIALKTHNSIHKYDFVCTGETYCDFQVETRDDSLKINGDKSIRQTNYRIPQEVVSVYTKRNH